LRFTNPLESIMSHHDETGLETEETNNTISSRKVEGTTVYGHDAEKLGTIQSFMVNKMSGQVEYAVLEFGGLLGMGSDHYPIPWHQLRYSPEHGGYVVDLDKDALKGAPKYDSANDDGFDNARGREVDSYYSTFQTI
jgi:sporulation protein YlmC with PRC-barrel domain